MVMGTITNVDLMFDFFDRLGFTWSESNSDPAKAIADGLYVPDNFEFVFHNRINDNFDGVDISPEWLYVDADDSQKAEWMEIFENVGHYRDPHTNEVKKRKPRGESHNVVGATYWEPKPNRAIFYDAEIYASMGKGNNQGIYIWSGWIAFVSEDGGVGSGGPVDRLIKTRMEIQEGKTAGTGAHSSKQFRPQYSNMVLLEFPSDSAENDRTIFPLKPEAQGSILYGESAFARYTELRRKNRMGTPDAINRWDV
jgi:hypothetical protein